MSRWIGGVLEVGLCLAAAEGPKGDEGLQGTWAVLKAERNGAAATDLDDHVLTFAGDRFTIRQKDKVVYAGTFQVDTSRKPNTIDFRNTEGAYKGKTWLGIFIREGDSLKICDNALATDTPRPTAFATRAGSGQVLVEFKRAK